MDLNSLQELKSEFSSNFGKYYFYEDEKYVIFEGIGRFAQPGISIEIIDGKKVNCIISEEEVLDISIKDGILYFTEELLLTEDISDPFIKRYVDILDFCKE